MMAARQSSFRGVMLKNELMARHTSWRVGGPADHFYKPAGMDDLVLFLQQLTKNEPVFWLGLGSNLLVRDGGIRGTVICTSGALNDLVFLQDQRIRAEAGVSCAKAARFCVQNGLAKAEFLAGIPGTMGGAVAMNAGAFGGETWQLIDEIETIDSTGLRRMRSPNDYQVKYREVTGPEGEWIAAVYLKPKSNLADFSLKDEKGVGKKQIKQLLMLRNSTQPTQQASAGSVFRNPPGKYSAQLIESADLKGKCIGGACVSDKHANFIVNMGNASAMDIESLIEYVKRAVKQFHGVDLTEEVHIVGEPAK
ncbi:MAG: UDP-N-acetylmuramate dehydrogenase [Gammaproteobacteria bacterium]|nr:UDP-N-acetylmuramate dehydrogenase [Gammaproteobacteria bacterium]